MYLYIYIYIYIYILFSPRVEDSHEKLPVTDGSSNELRTPVAMKRICKQRKIIHIRIIPLAYVEVTDILVVRYSTGVKSAGFRSQLKASRVSNSTDEL